MLYETAMYSILYVYMYDDDVESSNIPKHIFVEDDFFFFFFIKLSFLYSNLMDFYSMRPHVCGGGGTEKKVIYVENKSEVSFNAHSPAALYNDTSDKKISMPFTL